MRKEVVFAIIAGILIGLSMAFGTWKAIKLFKPKPTPPVKKELPNLKTNNNLIVDTISDFDVITENLNISGTSNPNSKILISTSEKDYLTSTDLNGTFKIEVSLPKNLSKIYVQDITSNEEKEFYLIYAPDIEKNSESYVGTVTDITAKTIQVKILNGGIAQVSIPDDAKIVNNLKKGIEIKDTDIAIGDYIIAIGDLNQNKVLQAKQIFVDAPIKEITVDTKKIKIEKKTKTSINDINLPKTWDGPNLKELELGSDIVIVGIVNSDKSYTLRSIFSVVE